MNARATRTWRTQYQMSGRKLRRARRLYMRLVGPTLLFGGDRVLLQCVKRMKEAGLYAQGTSVVLPLVSYVYEHVYGGEPVRFSLRRIGWDSRMKERLDKWNAFREKVFPLWSNDATFQDMLRRTGS